MKRGFDEIAEAAEEELVFILSSIRFPIEIGVMILNLLRDQSFTGFLTFLSVILCLLDLHSHLSQGTFGVQIVEITVTKRL